MPSYEYSWSPVKGSKTNITGCLVVMTNSEPRRAWCQLVFAGKTGQVVPDDEANNMLQCMPEIIGRPLRL